MLFMAKNSTPDDKTKQRIKKRKQSKNKIKTS